MAAKNTGTNSNPFKVGPAKMWKIGSPASGNTPLNKNLMTRGTMHLGGKSAYSVKQGNTMSPNGTFVLRKKG